ncbi:tyrosine-type recombinase/integrase [Aeromonas caviae]|uniref:tyrosine-type recombinase/integrase n=1 Tax=Aeromonas caviae TaxID=648 RepID=UPI002B251156|nr:site-specific integrase [Aeromonas caviae]MEA9432161.1 site-specific integrase [Aeromonas caviae]
MMKETDFSLPPFYPYFESIDLLEEANGFINEHVAHITSTRVNDAGFVYELTLDYLSELKHNPNNFKSSRSEITTFIIWCWDVEGIALADVTRRHMNRFLSWCNSPPLEAIGDAQRPQFLYNKELSIRFPNPLWRPFVHRAKKGEGISYTSISYQRKPSAIKNQLAILSSYYQFLNDEEYCERNPAALAMRRERFKSNQPANDNEEEIKALSPLQLAYLMDAAQKLAADEPARHERTLFLIVLLFSTYARISEISARPGYSPVMSQIKRDRNNETWGFFIPQSKNGKSRTVAVSDALLNALKRYRKYQGLSELPSPNEQTPLLIRIRPAQHGRDSKTINANLGVNAIRDEVEFVYKTTATMLENDGRFHDAADLRTMTVHSLRHTGISSDLEKGRSLHHVMADAGHQDIGITSRYITASRTERYESAKHKGIMQ